ncbi:MAG: S9 family peptidase [Caldimonas sp.]
MLRFLKSAVAAGAVFLSALGPPVAHAQAVDQIPVESLFKKAAYGGAVLSPNERYLAAITTVNARRNVVIIDLEKRAASVLTSYDARDVERVFWANDERLLYTTGDLQGVEFRGDGGLFSVNRDGKNPKILVEPLNSNSAARFVYRVTTVLARIKGNSEEVLVSANDRSADSQDVYRMNAYSGRKTLVSVRSPGRVIRWVLDVNNEPAAALSMDAEKKRWWFSVRSATDGAWVTAAQWTESLRDVVIPVAFDPADPGKLYVASNQGRDTLALYRFDLASRKVENLVYADDRFDIGSFYLVGDSLGEGGQLLFGGSDEEPGKLLGIRYFADRPKTVWFDRDAEALQKAVDSALPGTYNRFNLSQKRPVVQVSSDTNPGEYFLFDKTTRTLEETGMRTRPWIDPKKMAPMRYVTWKSTDGLDIGGYLTLPLGYHAGSPVPLVLHPHGGPWAKDNWRFDPEVQFMANRGFAVLQPNFRGSTGYGAKHLRSSYKEWGGTMIDDMLTGVDWAIKEGYADPNRIGVYGASYGGYATLMAMVKRPGMFKWGVNYVGVTDMFVHQDTQPAQRYGDFGELAKALNGDQRADSAIFEAQSPTRQVQRIAAPVFHAYGGEDRNVDVENGKVIRAAFQKAGKAQEWMLVPEEAHGFRADKNVFEFYNRFDKFIKANTPPASK